MPRLPIAHLILFLSMLLCSCSGVKSTRPDTPLRMEAKTFEKSAGKCMMNEPCMLLRLDYPEITAASSEEAKTKMNGAIRQWILRSTEDGKYAQTPEDLWKGLSEERQTVTKDFPDHRVPWYTKRTVKLESESPVALSFQCLEDLDTGGAHPNRNVDYLNFRPSTGDRVSLADILKAGSEPQLTQIAEKRFRQMKGLSANADLNESGFQFEKNQFFLNNNYSIGRDSLKFYYNNYEIAPYAVGPTELVIPYSEIKDLLRPEAGI